MPRKRYVITYDVADDRRRTKVMNALRDHGDHVQFSVFKADLNRRELVHLEGLLRALIHHKDDQVLIIDLGVATDASAEKMVALGRPYSPDVRARIV
jgi:CRISPR-associated protein Cas2